MNTTGWSSIAWALVLGCLLSSGPAEAQTVLYRVNCGGPALAAADSSSPDWSADLLEAPSPHVNADATGNQTYATGDPIELSPAVPASVPMALFQTERWDPPGADELRWSFPVAAGAYEVRLFFAEIYTGALGAGLRTFGVTVEGDTVREDLDVYAAVGGYSGMIESFPATVSDGSLDVGFVHSVENPAIKGIEVRSTSGTGALPIGFGSSVLAGGTVANPTSLQFGPDGRLYCAAQDGTLAAFTIARSGPNAYAVTAAETIDLIRNLPNRDDDGTLNPAVTTRQVTGLLVAGTAATPVIYVSSSDPRIGAGPGGEDTQLDTNSGILTRLTRSGAGWDRFDLVRGLPRSEENHGTNGLAIDTTSQTLYLTAGGNTNQGAPSNHFALLPEYALSAAVLAIDLGAIGEVTHDLSTLDDETRPNSGPGGADVGDPFGGNNGLNQAKLVPGGPVRIHAPGFRNPYDVVLTRAGRLYTIDNGPNAGWGAAPVGCANAVQEPGVTLPDDLHLIPRAGFYGGHPNPTRGDTANTFNPSNPQSPVAAANPIECIYVAPGAGDSALVTFEASTNGLAEYAASNFGGAMQGDLLAVGLDGIVWRMKADSTGAMLVDLDPPHAVLKQSLFSGFGSQPLDVTALDDDGPFPGTVWVAVYGGDKIQVFEPNDYSGGGTACTGADDPGLDEDADGYDNSDEIANDTNPCSAASRPPDWDSDFTSNLLDPDDDNDGQPDSSDAFALDADNGATTPLPVVFTWDNDEPALGGILDLGFTGLMTNGTADHESLFDPANMTAGGAAGVVTVDLVPEGDSRGASNSQEYGFQLGLAVGSVMQPFLVHTRILGPFAGITPQPFQSMGLFVGTGDQDHFLRIATAANGGQGGIEVVYEVGGTSSAASYGPAQGAGILGARHVDLWLRIDPATHLVQPRIAVDGGPVVDLGPAIGMPPAWHDSVLAAGIVSTSFGPAPPFAATWDRFEARLEQSTAAARVEVTPFGELNASTYDPGTIRVTNTSGGGEEIVAVRIDLATALFPDLAFDPLGAAGDLVAKCFSEDEGGALTGLVAPADPCSDPFESANDGGWDAITLEFTDFEPGETLGFSVDIDPTSIQGVTAPGPNESGSVSGLELTGAVATVEFGDGAVLTGPLFRIPGSDGGSRAVLAADPAAAPGLEMVGLAGSPAAVSSPFQTARVSGSPGDTVIVLRVEGGIFTAGVPGGGHDVEPYEANSALVVADTTAVIGPGGTVDVPVTLTHTGAEGGINVLFASGSVAALGGAVGPVSERWVVALGAVLPVLDAPPRTLGFEVAGSNPFRRAVALRLSLPAAAVGRADVFDLGGRRVRTLRHGRLEAGVHALEWNGRDDAGRRVAGGIYFVRYRDPAVEVSRRVVLLP